LIDTIDCGTITGTHGIRGELKLHCLLDDEMVQGLKTLLIGGTAYTLTAARPHKRMWLITLEGITTVEGAMALRGNAVACRRDDLPLPEGHYFYSDIYGFTVFDRRVNGAVGTLKEVQESPAGMLYIVEGEDGKAFIIPAVDAFKRGVDFDARRVDIETIPGMLPHES